MRCVVRTEHTYDVDLAEVELLRQSVSKFPRQISHLVERLHTFLIEPIDNLARAIERLAECANRLLDLGKKERLDVDLRVCSHVKTYGVNRFQQWQRLTRF